MTLKPALSYKDIPLPKGQTIQRLESYRTKNAWYKRPFMGKYNVRLYALTEKAVYDVTDIISQNNEKT